MSVSTFDDKHVTILTIVTVPAGKMMEFLTILSELHTIAAEGTTECIHYGWAVSGDQVLCRHGYIGGGYLQHVADVQSKMETAIPLVGGPGAFKTYAVGPSEELEKLKPALERSVSYNFVDGAFILNDYFGLSGESESVKKLASEHGAEAATMDKHISMMVTVTVDDEALEKMMAIFPKLQNTTKNGTQDCVYYNIATVTKGPNSHEVMIMDAYTTEEDTMQHMVDVAEHAQAMMACLPDGLVDEFHVIGTSAQVEKLKAVMPPFARPGGNFWWTLQDVAFLPFLRNKLPNKKVGFNVLSIFSFKPEHVGEIRDLVASEGGLKLTKAFKGNVSLEAKISIADPSKLYMWQKWESEEDIQAYIAWRGTTEFMANLASKFSEPPQIFPLSKAKF